MKKKSFSYAEAMVTMLIVAIIMVATTPILSQRKSVNKQSIWDWANKSEGGQSTSIFFGTSGEQRVVLGSNNVDADETARLVLHQADNNNSLNTPPFIRFFGEGKADLGRLITTANSVGLGAEVFSKNPTSNNTAVGAGALKEATAEGNTAFGVNACSGITEGTGNVCIGANAGPTADQSNKLYINSGSAKSDTPLIYGDFSEHKVTINGQLYINTGGTEYNVKEEIEAAKESDLRLKDVKGVSKAGLEQINKIVVKNFTFKNDKNKNLHVGVIAQELQKIFPNSVKKGDDGYLRVNREEMFFAMINAIKELSAKFNKNDAKIQKMEQEIESLRKENAVLTQKITEIEQKLQKK